MEINKSSFSTASQLERIDILLNAINYYSLNPLQRDITQGLYHYEIWFFALNNLRKEMADYLIGDESKKVKEFKLKVMKSRREKLIWELKVDEGIRRTKKYKRLNNKNWDELQNLLNDYELFLRSLLSKYNLLSLKNKQRMFV